MERDADLSPEQAEAVGFDPGGGHLLVLARPGSGKTHTLASRARRLLHDGVEPSQLLAMTFSNRAANELKDRLPGGDIWAGTFHAICADILERHGAAIGVRWPFRIVDEVRAREILLRAISDVGFPLPDDERWRGAWLRQLESSIELRKRQGRERGEPADGEQLDADMVARIDESYCRLLREANALDFADLIAKAVETLEQDEVTAEALRNRIDHLLIDEFHDISPEQYRLMALLAPPRSASQVFVVGDPDQAIYGWRGADAGRMLGRYRADFRPTELHLTVNFRSVAPIVTAADALMADDGRTRPSRPHRDGAVRPFWCRFPDARAEAREVAASIGRAMQLGRFGGYGDFAVLYRTHAIGNAVEAELLRAVIPIHRVQRERFFHDPDAQESLRYLELAFGLYHADFEPALSWPRVIVDEVTMVRLRQLAERRGLRLSELVRQVADLGDDVSPLTRGAIKEFLATIGRDLGPLAGLTMAEALGPFLDALKSRRSPVPRAEREAMRDTLDLLEPTLRDAHAALERALHSGRMVRIRANSGADCVAAELIVRHTLHWYLESAMQGADPASDAPDAFTITLGEECVASVDEIGLGPLRTRTVTFSVATRVWRLMQMLLMGRETAEQGAFVLLDVETSNQHPERAELLEFGALPFVDGVISERGVVSLVRPSSPGAIDPLATDVHGLRWSDVSDAPRPFEILPELVAALEDQIVVGHNIEQFDLPVLRRAAERAGLPFRPPHSIDTCRMAERLWPDEASYRLEDLARRADPTAVQRHRSRDDCLLNGMLFRDLLVASRREREIDVLSECLPLVAASIVARDYVVANDNALLAGIGARSLALGHGASLFTDWELGVEQPQADAARSTMQTAILAAPEEDDAWERLARGWRITVDAFCASDQDQGIARFLRYAALAQPVDTLPRSSPTGDSQDPRLLAAIERVTLMTVHSAKGLEWPVVFLVGVEDDQFLHYNTKTTEQIAEERRILYVGMTRARDRLLLFSAGERDGRPKRRSRFLDRIGSALHEVHPGRGSSSGS
jgi:superfamily I DNA/RNA helicase/DNA polymerase III epsilon subunit-like protein